MAADRKSTRLNSSHLGISYAVFCLKKKKTLQKLDQPQPTAAPPNPDHTRHAPPRPASDRSAERPVVLRATWCVCFVFFFFLKKAAPPRFPPFPPPPPFPY